MKKRLMIPVLCFMIAAAAAGCGRKDTGSSEENVTVADSGSTVTAEEKSEAGTAPEAEKETQVDEEKDESAGSGFAGIPNPIVEYDSLEEINEKAGVSLMRPAIMGVSDESYSVIADTIAQYVCDINGTTWVFRGACVTDEDISGMFHEQNVFNPNEDFALYTNEFYLERFFDGPRQYTIAAEGPVNEDGEIIISEETFMNCCMEMEAIQKQHMDDPLVGDYRNTADERMILYVERHGDEYAASVNLNISETEIKCWTISGAVQEGDKLTYRGEEIYSAVYDAEGNEISSDTAASNNLGYFEIRDGRLYWTGAAQEECRECVFEKIIYEE